MYVTQLSLFPCLASSKGLNITILWRQQRNLYSKVKKLAFSLHTHAHMHTKKYIYKHTKQLQLLNSFLYIIIVTNCMQKKKKKRRTYTAAATTKTYTHFLYATHNFFRFLIKQSPMWWNTHERSVVVTVFYFYCIFCCCCCLVETTDQILMVNIYSTTSIARPMSVLKSFSLFEPDVTHTFIQLIVHILDGFLPLHFCRFIRST